MYGLMWGVGAAPNPDLAGTIPISLYFLFQLMFAVITPALIIGSVADRWVGGPGSIGCVWPSAVARLSSAQPALS